MSAAAPKLRATRIEVRDVLGAERVEIRPGRVTVLSGPNGSGKTTVLSAISRALGRGNLAEIQRISADGSRVEPRVVLELESDGPVPRHLVVERNASRVRLRERDQEGALRDVQQPQRAIAALWDAACANPAQFLSAPPEDRIRLLYEALPLELDRSRVAEILAGLDVQRAPGGLHALEELRFLRAQVFEARTSVNRDAASKAEAAQQIRSAAPASPGGDAADQAQLEEAVRELSLALQAEQVAADEAEQASLRRSAQEFREACAAAASVASNDASALHQQHREWAAAERAALEQRIAARLVEVNAHVELLRGEESAVREAAQIRRDVATEAARRERLRREGDISAWRAELEGAQAAAMSGREAAKTAASARALAAQAETFEADARTLKGHSARLTAAIQALDEYLRSLGSSLPSGLEVRGRELLLDGIPWDQQNTARRIEVAVAISALRARAADLPLVLVDGAEALDPAHFNGLVEALEAAGLQAIVTCVSPNADARGLHVEAIA